MTYPRMVKAPNNANQIKSNIEIQNNNMITHQCKILQYMLDHPLTVVLNDFDTSKNNGLKVYKFMGIQTQEDHISHI